MPGSPMHCPLGHYTAMRHSRIELTMNYYTDPILLDVAGAVEALPDFQTPASLRAHGLAPTGTSAR